MPPVPNDVGQDLLLSPARKVFGPTVLGTFLSTDLSQRLIARQAAATLVKTSACAEQPFLERQYAYITTDSNSVRD
ncbi:unnamed protein product [Somion occarium]|uniref:Uncharacterized protein n=1 Tax=Somion occarium TaxID=3059160 RepID=A0ABP1D6U1_9APHY